MSYVTTQTDRVKRLFGGPAANWWNWRRKRFWVIVLLALYTLVGFLIVPWIAKRQLVDGLQTYLDLPVRLDELRVNPWSMRVEAKGFSIDEPNGTTMIGFDGLVINVQASSLFRWALTLREVTVDHPHGRIIRHPDGALNLERIIEASSGGTEEPPVEDGAAPLRMLVHDLSIIDGLLEVRDDTHATPFAASVGPIDISVEDLTTLPDRSGRHRIAVSTDRGTQLEWIGSFELDPISSSGRITGTGPYVPLLYQYFQDQLNFELTEGHVDLEFDYEVGVDADGGINAQLMNANTVLRNAGLTVADEAGGTTRFASLPEIRLEAGSLSWPEQRLAINALVVADADLKLWLDEQGVLNIERLLAAPADTEPLQDTDEESADVSPAWDISLAEFRIENLTAEFTDRSLETDGAVQINKLDFSLKDISNRPGDAFPVELKLDLAGGGDVSLSGNVQVLPDAIVDANIRIENLALDHAQPWLTEVARVEVDAGTLEMTTQINVSADETLGISGNLNVLGLDISDSLLDERLVGWNSLKIDRMKLSVSENRFEISELALDQPYARLRIAEDQSTNFQALVVTDSEPADDVPPDEESASTAGTMAVTVGRVAVDDGSADFSDLSLPLPFAARISELNGKVDTLATASDEPAKIGLAGKVDEYGLVEVSGQIKPLDPTASTDINVLFRNVGLPGMSPYTIKFAGREIDEGRIELDLRYVIESGRLQGENGIVIDKLQLGEKVEHPEAVNLPLGLAVALLKGPDGTIDIDMPVSGDVNDPEFSIGGVVFRAFVNLITKIATSPFSLLGKLVGVESEDFDRIEFRPGLAELAPPEKEKLVKLSEAMTLRPNLNLDLVGVVDPDADAAALRAARISAEIEAGLAEGDDGADAEMLADRRLEVIEALAREKLTTVDFAAIEAAHQRPRDPEDPDGRTVLDGPAYSATLEALLIENESVMEADLENLALARAEAVRGAIVSDKKVTEDRILLGAASTAKLSDGGWVPLQLELSTRGRASQGAESSVSN